MNSLHVVVFLRSVGGRDAMVFQDVPDGLVADLVTEVADGTCDAVVPPIAVFRGQSDNEALELWADPWATRIRSLFEPSNFLATSRRCQARIVSGRAMVATSAIALRPSRLPISARVRRSPSFTVSSPGSWFRRMRFSATRYSFRRTRFVSNAQRYRRRQRVHPSATLRAPSCLETTRRVA